MNELLPLYREMAAGGANFRGLSILSHRDVIGDLIAEHQALTILDFGAGAGEAYKPPHEVHLEWGVTPTLYDPAFPEHDQVPPAGVKFHGVLCSDVLEHVPAADVDDFIRGLFERAERFVWVSVCCRAAKKTFPDGTNLHVTVETHRWWRRRFAALAPAGMPWALTETP